MNSTRWVLAMIAVLSLGVACSNDATGGDTQAGTLTVRLTTPHADDGAITFTVSGPPIDAAAAINASLRLFTRREGDSTVVGAVVGALADGVVITLHVPDVGAAARYTATVLEVADRQDALRTSLAGYALTVAP
jgi:ABC-type glycerol-3-phosphate transport system substrate-binding protein